MTSIAVAVPTYLRPEYLLALTQSLPPQVPISVSDNAGSMAGLLTPFGVNVVIHHADNQIPIFANWNRALFFVPGETTHVLIPSDDDLYLPGAIDAVQAALRRHPDADMIVFGCDYVDEHGNTREGWCPAKEYVCEPGDGFLAFEHGVTARMPGVIFRRAFLNRIGAFDERFVLTAADSELIQRAALLGRTAFVPIVIGLYRVWTGSLTHSSQATDLWMDEIDLWTAKIAALLKAGHQPSGPVININQYRDEILARNLLAALGNLLNKGEVDQACDFLRRHPVPSHATLPTRLRLLRQRLRIWMRLQ